MILNRFWSLIYSPTCLYRLWRSIRKQQSFIKEELEPRINAFIQSPTDGTLSDSDFKKMYGYYALGVPAILGHMFCLLQGRKMQFNERLTSTMQGALTGLFDDFFDNHALSPDYIYQLVLNQGRQIKKDNEKLFRWLLSEAQNLTFYPEEMLKCLLKVHSAQVDSLEQRGSITEDRLKQISIDKGGLSVIYYRWAFQHKLESAESSMLYSLGGIMQLGNDVFDVYKDIREGVHTLITDTKDIVAIKDHMNQAIRELDQKIEQLNVLQKNKQRFRWHVKFFWSRVRVCLDQLYAIQVRNENVFDAYNASRKELVCDMEKWTNLKRMILYTLS